MDNQRYLRKSYTRYHSESENQRWKNFQQKGSTTTLRLGELGRESTSLDTYAYTSEAPENWIISVLKEEYAHMLKNDDHYYIVSQITSENKHLFEAENQSPSTPLQ